MRVAPSVIRLAEVGSIEITTDATVAFAWAMGETFATRRLWTWMQFDPNSSVYIPAFGART